ncbi:MAG: diguanylate cyclase [Pseudomonadota bacterium]
MTAEQNPWRQKYRHALAQQEQLEKTLSAQQAILQRAVATLTVAAEGYDSTLDERLQAIRASAKLNDVAGFDRMLKSMPRITEDLDKRQQQQWQEVVKTLGDIANQIQKQSPQADIKPAVKHFRKQLPKGVLIPATLKRLLQQLSDLQQQALNEQSEDASGGLLGRLFGDKSREQPPAESVAASDYSTDAEWEEIEETDIASIEGDFIRHEQEPSAYRERNVPEALLEQPKTESEVGVPDKVSVILVELLDHFKTVPSAEQKAVKARRRIQQGLKWFELAPTLEDIRDFVLQAYIGADNDYRLYLENLYGELSEVLQALGVTVVSEERIRKVANDFHNDVNQGMDNISQALSNYNNIDQLKNAVEGHVQQLQHALANFTQGSKAPSDTASLAQQLQALVTKVQTMEQNEESIRKKLAQEQQRALTDSLTGLPNREAYGQLIHQEMQRWQRYQHPLSLAVLDIDFFKKFNDNYGHQTGDKVLKIVANAVSKRLRNVDFMARFGGEEFIVVLPETKGDSALETLNRIRDALANAPFRYRDEKLSITVSIGVSEFKQGDDAETVFARADEALYKAKESGRNRCCLA